MEKVREGRLISMVNWSWAGMSQIATASEFPPHLNAWRPTSKRDRCRDWTPTLNSDGSVFSVNGTSGLPRMEFLAVEGHFWREIPAGILQRTELDMRKWSRKRPISIDFHHGGRAFQEEQIAFAIACAREDDG